MQKFEKMLFSSNLTAIYFKIFLNQLIDFASFGAYIKL